MKVCLRSAFTLLTRDPLQNTQWLLFPLENCSLQTDVAIIPPSSCSLNHVVITRLPLTSLLASSPSLPPSTLSPPLALSLLRLSGRPSGRMSAIDLYEQHFSSDAGLWLVPNRIQQTRDRVTDRLTST